MSGYDYISFDDYKIIRNGLLDNNNNVVKMSIQSLITQLEENNFLHGLLTKDLCAILYKILQNSDYKIRKWAYHLIAYKNTSNLIDRCIDNLVKGNENDSENITWIMAIASIKLNQIELYRLYKQHAEQKISILDYKVCTMIFSVHGESLNRQFIKEIFEKGNFLSKMWLTKMYACVYKETKKKQFVELVNQEVMNELLRDEKLNRYALWAFSTFKRVNLEKIDIKPYNVVNLHVNSQAWYYNCMFKDEQYVLQNRDHIVEILEDFHLLTTVVQTGILRGLEGIQYNLGYIESKLVKIYFDLDEENVEDIPLLISLTRIFLKHVNESGVLGKILMDTKSYTKIEAIKRIIFFYNNNEKEQNGMARVQNFNGPTNYYEKPVNVVQNYTEVKISDNSFKEIPNQIKEISEKLEVGDYDEILDTQSIELGNMITTFEFELTCSKSIVEEIENPHIKEKLDELEKSIAELKSGKLLERKAKFSNFLTKFSEVCTVIMATPQLGDIAKNIMIHIKNFLNI